MDRVGTDFDVTRVPGPHIRLYNVLSDRTRALGTETVQNKHQLAGADRYWPLASLQSAQSAARALAQRTR